MHPSRKPGTSHFFHNLLISKYGLIADYEASDIFKIDEYLQRIKDTFFR